MLPVINDVKSTEKMDIRFCYTVYDKFKPNSHFLSQDP